MADSNNPSQRRAYDPQERTGGTEATERRSDPLAELARLIGQSDPFADFERNRAGAHAQRSIQPNPSQPTPSRHAASYPDDYPGLHAHDSAPTEGAEAQRYSEPYAASQHPDQAPDYPAEYPADPYQDYEPYEVGGEGLDETDYLVQQEQRRRRNRLATVIAILVFAVIGGAGAYGYRTFFVVNRRSPPPVIKADTAPNKVIPAAHASDSRSAKLIYDRVGDGKQTERVVPREETPVDLKAATIAARPPAAPPSDANVVPSPPPATVPVTGRSPTGPVLPTASDPGVASHPSGAILPYAKKVRTVVIRPDMTVVPNPEPVSDPAPAPSAAPVHEAEAQAEPEQTRSVTPATAAPSPILPRAAAPPAPRQTASAPLSLSPGDVTSSSPPTRPAQRTAARTPARPAAGANYVVQVSSQRSEADANASFRTLQARYPKVLGGQSSFVRRADLGSRGVYYRSMVGPFATAEEAGQFCGSLKAAGGQCIVHRN